MVICWFLSESSLSSKCSNVASTSTRNFLGLPDVGSEIRAVSAQAPKFCSSEEVVRTHATTPCITVAQHIVEVLAVKRFQALLNSFGLAVSFTIVLTDYNGTYRRECTAAVLYSFNRLSTAIIDICGLERIAARARSSMLGDSWWELCVIHAARLLAHNGEIDSRRVKYINRQWLS